MKELLDSEVRCQKVCDMYMYLQHLQKKRIPPNSIKFNSQSPNPINSINSINSATYQTLELLSPVLLHSVSNSSKGVASFPHHSKPAAHALVTDSWAQDTPFSF